MFPSSKSSHLRDGISIIEVLTSIVVAMIGVFGVMILIPFAVKQAQTGLDRDAATVVARNAYAQFEIAGFRDNRGWIIKDISGTVRPVDPMEPPQAFSIDPLAVVEQPGGSNYDSTKFPFAAASYPMELRLPVANLNRPIPGFNPFEKSDARRMFRGADDLVFLDAESAPGIDAALNGPKQSFDFNAGGDELRRQSIGRLSWSAIVLPVKGAGITSNEPWKYRMFILVYKDRTTQMGVTESEMGASVVATPPPLDVFTSPVSTVTINGAIDERVRKDDWAMLINRNSNEIVAGMGTGFEYRVGYYRIVNFSSDTMSSQVTLDGPDFDFSTSEEGTYLVHLKDVVGVYERSFTPEGASNWNLSAN